MDTRGIIGVLMAGVLVIAMAIVALNQGPMPLLEEFSPCNPHDPTHYLICGDGYHKEVFVYKNGGYVCAEYGGVVEMGDNCTLVPLPPTTEAP